MSLDHIPAGVVGVLFILLIASLFASATARRDGIAQQSADDGEAPRG